MGGQKDYHRLRKDRLPFKSRQSVFVMPLYSDAGKITPAHYGYSEAARKQNAVFFSPLPLVQSLSLSRLASAVPRESSM